MKNKRSVIKNAQNRKFVYEMAIARKIYALEYYISKLMEGQMHQNEMISNGLQNLAVSTDTLKKKVVKFNGVQND